MVGRGTFGISNALVGDWPVVEIRNKKARIVEFGSIPQWLMRHKKPPERRNAPP